MGVQFRLTKLKDDYIATIRFKADDGFISELEKLLTKFYAFPVEKVGEEG